jgi:hypothetical protein
MTIGTLLMILAIPILFVNFRVEVNRDRLGNVTSVSWIFPNLQYSIGIAVVGIVFVGVGSAFRIRDREDKSRMPTFLYKKIQSPPPPPTSFCPYCGTPKHLMQNSVLNAERN